MKLKTVLFFVLVASILSVSAGFAAQEPYSRRTPIVEAFEKNKNSVVSITSKYATKVDLATPFWFWGGDDFPFLRRQMEIPSLGSGFIINPDGYILTNAHVVARADSIEVITSDGSRYQSQKVAEDQLADLALLKIDSDKPLSVVTFNCDDLMIGETVLAVGNPFGYQQTLTDGILSAIHRDVELAENLVLPEMIQISAPINPGNSGGPLLNINGEVIGMNTAIRRAAQGIGFAIPIERIRKNLLNMLNKEIETQRRLDFGLTVDDIKQQENSNGILVRSLHPDRAASRVGFQPDDIITAVDGQKITSAIDFYLAIMAHRPPTAITFQLLRDKLTDQNAKERYREITLTLRERDKPDGIKLAQRLLGMQVESLTQAKINLLRLVAEPGDIMVKKVENKSAAYEAGIKTGDIIAELDDQAIGDIDQLGLKLETLEGETWVKILLYRTQKWSSTVLERKYYTGFVRIQGNDRQVEADTERVDL